MTRLWILFKPCWWYDFRQNKHFTVPTRYTIASSKMATTWKIYSLQTFSMMRGPSRTSGILWPIQDLSSSAGAGSPSRLRRNFWSLSEFRISFRKHRVVDWKSTCSFTFLLSCCARCCFPEYDPSKQKSILNETKLKKRSTKNFTNFHLLDFSNFWGTITVRLASSLTG